MPAQPAAYWSELDAVKAVYGVEVRIDCGQSYLRLDAQRRDPQIVLRRRVSRRVSQGKPNRRKSIKLSQRIPLVF
jgi:hypothetical protein